MAVLVLVMGDSGTGKSTSLRNFHRGEVEVVNVLGKPLPFRADFNCTVTDDYNKIIGLMQRTAAQSIVVDDFTYLMTGEFMRTAKVVGYQKFTDMAENVWKLIKTASTLPADKIVYFMSHIARGDMGDEKPKTIGKMLDEKVCIEGMFTVALRTMVKDGRYVFVTQSNGQTIAKSPRGMFAPVIDNDLAAVDKTIRDYYGIAKAQNTQAQSAQPVQTIGVPMPQAEQNNSAKPMGKDSTAQLCKLRTDYAAQLPDDVKKLIDDALAAGGDMSAMLERTKTYLSKRGITEAAA